MAAMEAILKIYFELLLNLLEGRIDSKLSSKYKGDMQIKIK